MSIQTQITRLQGLKNTLRNKLISMSLVQPTATLSDCVSAVNTINDNGAVNITLDSTTDSYSVVSGYHNGLGEVKINPSTKTITANGTYTPESGCVFSSVTVNVQGGGSGAYQTKNVTPTTAVQNVTPDNGYDALSLVTLQSIPSNYCDISSVTAAAQNVLANKIFVASDGSTKTGTMVNNGSVSGNFNGIGVNSYTIAEGYHDGTGAVTLSSDIETLLVAI